MQGARCAICDHQQGFANEYLYKAQKNNPVHWRKDRFLCNECHYSTATDDTEKGEWELMHLDNWPSHVRQPSD